MSALNQPHFQDADKARQYLEAIQWPNGPVCPHCGVVGTAYKLEGKAHRDGLYKCKDCREQFTVTVGTVFERSKIKLNVWLQAVFLLCSSKKGMSAHQLHRTLGVTYKTAWFMAHRIREAFRTGGGPLGGGGNVVEADETYWGQIKDRKPMRKGAGLAHKHKIVSLVSRNGESRSFHVANVNVDTVQGILKAHVKQDTKLYTDTAAQYKTLKRGTFQSHRMTNHSQGEYAKPGGIHSNTVEAYFGILKRGLHGTYHHVSEAHLQRYLQEFDFRFTHRTSQGVNDHERTNAALKGIAGKRLTYRRTDAVEGQALTQAD
jgi:transposase-like protein